MLCLFLFMWILAADRSALLITVALCLFASLFTLALAAAFLFCKSDLVLAYRNLVGFFTKQEGYFESGNVSLQTLGHSDARRIFQSKLCCLLCSSRGEALRRLRQPPQSQQQVQQGGSVRPANPSRETGDTTRLLSVHPRPRWFRWRRSGEGLSFVKSAFL